MALPRFRKNRDRWLLGVVFLLLLLSFAYLAKGFYNLTVDNQEGAKDLFERWQEQQYIYRGHDPYSIGKDPTQIIPEVGLVRSGGYPPWAFFTGFLLIPPVSWEIIRWYHALLNLISLAILGKFSYNLGIAYGRIEAFLSVAAVLAISSNCTTLNNGQYGLIINALLIGMLWLLTISKDSWAGLLYGLAAIKPNISAFYFLILLVRRRVNALLIFFIYITFSILAIWKITKISPLNMIERFLKQANYFADKGTSGVNLMLSLGIQPIQSIFILGLIGITLIGIIVYYCRSYSWLTLFAVASVIGRVVTYHKIYDNVMLVFLLLALLEDWFRTTKKSALFILTLVAVSLWLPGAVIDSLTPYSQIFQYSSWLGGVVYLLIEQRKPLMSDLALPEKTQYISNL